MHFPPFSKRPGVKQNILTAVIMHRGWCLMLRILRTFAHGCILTLSCVCTWSLLSFLQERGGDVLSMYSLCCLHKLFPLLGWCNHLGHALAMVCRSITPSHHVRCQRSQMWHCLSAFPDLAMGRDTVKHWVAWIRAVSVPWLLAGLESAHSAGEERPDSVRLARVLGVAFCCFPFPSAVPPQNKSFSQL